MMPVLGAALLESIDLLANVSTIFRERCVDGIEAKKERCNELIEYSLAMVTGLNSKIGYDKAAEIAKESAKTGIPVRKLCMDRLKRTRHHRSGAERSARSRTDDASRMPGWWEPGVDRKSRDHDPVMAEAGHGWTTWGIHATDDQSAADGGRLCLRLLVPNRDRLRPNQFAVGQQERAVAQRPPEDGGYESTQTMADEGKLGLQDAAFYLDLLEDILLQILVGL